MTCLRSRGGRGSRVGTKTQCGDSSAICGLKSHVVPFHWQIEFPEVFDRIDSGFDVFIGNPPFMAGKNIAVLSGQQLPQLAEGIVLERWRTGRPGRLLLSACLLAPSRRRGFWAARYKHDCTGGYKDCLSCSYRGTQQSIFNATKAP